MSTTPPLPDSRSYNRRLLDQVRALLLGKSLDDVAMYKIGGRELTHIPLPELRAWEADLEARVDRERRRKLGLPARNSYIIFGAAARRGPRFAALRLLLGRILIALHSDPTDRKSEPVETPKQVVYRSAPTDAHRDDAYICRSHMKLRTQPDAPNPFVASPCGDQRGSAYTFEDAPATFAGELAMLDVATEDSAPDYSSSPDITCTDSGFNGGQGGDSGGAGAGGDW